MRSTYTYCMSAAEELIYCCLPQKNVVVEMLGTADRGSSTKKWPNLLRSKAAFTKSRDQLKTCYSVSGSSDTGCLAEHVSPRGSYYSLLGVEMSLLIDLLVFSARTSSENHPAKDSTQRWKRDHKATIRRGA